MRKRASDWISVGRVESAEVDGVEVVGRGMNFVGRPLSVDRIFKEPFKGGRLIDRCDFLRGVAGEI